MKTSMSFEHAMVRVGPLTCLADVLRELGHDPVPLFRKYGFKTRQFENPDFRIPFIPGSQLLAECVEATACDHLGLLIGKRAHPSCLGIPSFTMQAAPDVERGLKALLKHWELHDQGGVPSLRSTGITTQLGFTLHLPGIRATPQIYDISMSVACGIMRILCGKAWNPSEVLLSRPEPADPTLYRKYFRAPIHYDADHSAIRFHGHWLTHALPGADPFLFAFLDEIATGLQPIQPLDLTGRLRRYLFVSLGSDDCSLAPAAKHLGLHERSLNRQLREMGTSFRQILDEIRFEAAQQMLTNNNVPNEKIASTLGYADATGFNRAFRRWSGMTPTQWRRTQRKI